MDHAKEAGKLRKRAEDCRTLAEIMKDPNARDSYLGLAAAYEALAKNEEAMLSLTHQLKDDAGSAIGPPKQGCDRKGR